MADACSRCSGRQWNWNGYRRVPCMKCSPHLRGQYLPDPGKDWCWTIPVADWPAFSARLRAREGVGR